MGGRPAALGGPHFVQFASYAIPIIGVAGLLRRTWSGYVMPLAFMAAAALPYYAFVSGHPFRIRYEVPLILACAVCIGAAGLFLRFPAFLVSLPLPALV